jgi:two-component system sensor histidine kinase UhpB
LVTQWKSQHREAAVILSLPEALDGLDEPVGLTIYRIVQESLTNVSRHADASEVTVSVDYDRAPAETGGRPVVRVIVRDNGVGMPPAAKHGLGLLGMRERILALGGHMKITNAPDGGVAVEASLSLAEHVVASEAAGEARTLH